MELFSPLRLSVPEPQIDLIQLEPQHAKDLFALIQAHRDHLSQFDNAAASRYRDRRELEDELCKLLGDRYAASLGIIWNDRLAGTIRFDPKPDSLHAHHLGYWVLPEFCRRGFASAAVGAVSDYLLISNLCRVVEAYIHYSNRFSARAAAKAGFHPINAWHRQKFRVYQKTHITA